jgi:Putative  PD-(D/E)XK family member, (DUF4420)
MIDPAVWADLERPVHSPGLAARRLHPETAHDLFAAVEHPARRRMLIYEPASVVDPGTGPPDGTRALELRLAPGASTPVGDRWELVLTDSSYGNVFSVLAADVADAVAETPDAEAATKVLLERFGHWRRLFEGVAGAGLSTPRRRGLFGELWFLREELFPRLPPLDAVRGWTGPSGAHQDFQLPDVAVEVKTTTGKEPQTLVVNSERELDRVGVPNLLLAHLSVDERVAGDGESLNDIVDTLAAGLPDLVVRDMLQDRLTTAGYWDRHRENYHSPRFVLRRQRLYEVGDEFPRIVEGDLRAGVGDVRYRISAAACRPFLAASGTLDRLVGGAAA